MKWYCAVKLNGGVQAKMGTMDAAQRFLGIGSSASPQAIFVMRDSYPVKEFDLPLSKSWSGGSMWWENWNDIQNMQKKCSMEKSPIFGKSLNNHQSNSVRVDFFVRVF